MENERSSDECSPIDEIFLSKGDDFIMKAYQFILRRKADGAGLNHYRRVLKKTGSKAKIASDLLASVEGRTHPHWEEVKATVRKQRSREFWRGDIFWRRRIPRCFERPFKKSNPVRDLSSFAKSVSPRTMTLAKILASAERG